MGKGDGKGIASLIQSGRPLYLELSVEKDALKWR